MMLLPLLMLLHIWAQAANISESDMELLLVHAIWRHGDRSPTTTFRKDPFQEGHWTFGGGGFGQLSPIGMKQHMELGKLIRKLYIDDMQFLSRRYSSKEIYVLSTDRNRTITSAMSNILGMYGTNNSNAIPDVDYPADVDGWPAGFVPVAIHTGGIDPDYLDPDASCTRREHLWNMAKTSQELQDFVNRPDIASLLANLTEFCGEPITLDNLYVVWDALKVEQTHDNDTLRRVNTWFSDELFERLTAVHDKIHEYQNGIFDRPLVMNNLDIGREIQKIRGGSLFSEIFLHMDTKWQCLNQSNSSCKWINGLKYYAYSAHDSTIYAFFTILGIQNKVVSPTGYPDYAAATFIELWKNRTDNEPYFKLFYHQNEVNDTLYAITHLIDACKGLTYCHLDKLKPLAAKSRPDQPLNQWCNVDPRPRTSTSHSAPALLSLAFPIVIFLTWINSWNLTSSY
ncbi:Intestinal acid phosphatase [Trichostrongylus colubriformis]|uniref:acid phosphatase n=1 Tax=Trichostrongylus colubriformis TaxID=6319 RepID=A0AAN8FHZ6_TRICO